MYEIVATLKFAESLKKLDSAFQELVKEKLKFYSQLENPLVYSKKLQGHRDIFRWRAGNFRIIFQLSKHQIVLQLVKHRKDVYENL